MAAIDTFRSAGYVSGVGIALLIVFIVLAVLVETNGQGGGMLTAAGIIMLGAAGFLVGGFITMLVAERQLYKEKHN